MRQVWDDPFGCPRDVSLRRVVGYTQTERGTETVTATHLPPNWQRRLLAVLGADPGYAQGIRLLSAWQVAEGGTAKWNPLNTTYKISGSTNYNAAGVQNYKRATEGVCATALTFVNGFYPGIVGALQAGTATAENIVQAHAGEIRTWGTDPRTILAVLAE